MTTYIIETPSAKGPLDIWPSNCLLGEGPTKQAAWEDAYGPKPWTPYTRKCAKNAWCRAVEEDELRNLQQERAER